MSVRRRVAAAAIVAFAAGLPLRCGTAAAADDRPPAGWSVAALFAEFARAPRREARFVERRFLGVLDAPIDARGELRFVPPSRLEKLTRAPARERLLVDGDTLTVERDGLVRTTTLREFPELAPIVDGLRATLGGDLAALERAFRVDSRGGAPGWTIRLVPRDASLARAVAAITLRGAAYALQVVEIEQGDGDRSVMRVLD